MFPIVKPDDWCSKYKAKPKPEAHEAHEDFQKVLDTWVDDDE
jgi:hypothetical protein